MTRSFFVGGNWKLNPTSLSAAKALVEALNKADLDPSTEVVVAPPALYLLPIQEIAGKAVKVAAQNAYFKESGAFTGEISPKQISDAGIPYVILGHSERRTLFHETSEVVALKTRAALDNGLKVILCIGETLKEREEGRTAAVCEEQLSAVVKQLKEEDWSNIVIAYEPVWAIGTGKVATTSQAQETHVDVRKYLATAVSPKVASETRVIYGGSVNAANSKDLASQQDIDGFLVGGASLKPEFVDIINARKA
ncbi:triosephosphate isomerase [Coprinopsis cinerea okayama7|uniref:Triosephosphate isomerase n=1 Tax=Coprinopsis cinerea (strain Okayama-7 / 130 / ATCC MYA-4618 / FGSC 9003) TaxID=240176 RepID=TPIS_COPC7|nr:triosephosphate isomerase [Coprinopsis cinerea okayama7\|eukprot:XP_001835145.1 triosephosphate isomerase [Coprinopsis cinerea okayama7\